MPPVDDGATPTPGQGAEGNPERETFDYERAYRELQPEFTRRSQSLSEYEQLISALHDPDPEVQAAALDALGLEPAEDTGDLPDDANLGDDEWIDPLEQEVQELRSTVEELREQAELEATATNEAERIELRNDYIDQALDFIEQSTGQEFTQEEEEVLGNLAIAMADEDEVPDVQAAYQRLYGESGVLETRRQQWIESKTGARSAPLGTTIPADQKPKTSEDRVRYMDERWRAISDQQ